MAGLTTIQIAGIGVAVIVALFGILNPDKVQAAFAKLPWNKNKTPVVDPNAPPVMKATGAEIVDEVKQFFDGLGFVQKLETIKGDFDSAKALFLTRALSHEVEAIVLDADKPKVRDAFQGIAAAIAANTTPPVA